ncbi:L,D-transpeptidase family protein [Roseomonas terrae]|jgi:murein L,D-transpeptidase YcbB/YkuD|uniref:L,D-transpeptidase family protein n=1 Tax=Neoroseomonas terrae TaxID=424799 RepID=A0ABS5EF36_9PROT|nr:L,D-transpeptidase family protein [Neoroseomonas terrae]MBR0649636.1 L,D-transpeptidase family protein [Neoroseomonas terrae]
MRALLILPLLAATALVPPTGPALASGTDPTAMTAVNASQAAIQRLADRLARLEEDGLDPRHYAVPAPELAATDPAAYRAGTLRSAQAALSDLLLGRVNGLRGRVDLRRDPAAANLPAWTAELAAAAEPAQVIDRAADLPPDARAIKAVLAQYRAGVAAGGWPRITGDTRRTLEPGSTDAERVPQLRARLAATDRAVTDLTTPVYDEALLDAVKRFQASEGLETDGRVGTITWTALNVPIEAKLNQLRVALDMRRGQGPRQTERRIEVNVPFYRLQLLEGDRAVLDMAVIVGRRDRQTPMLNVRMTSVQFNPPWGVPERNAREDLLPRFQRNPAAMRAGGYRLFQRVEGESIEIDPETVDFSAYSRNNFPYFIRQDAGERNALGNIKFVMPNNDAIFMHDTPDRHLFTRGARAFSSGCIRLERPMELLSAALSGTSWDGAQVNRVLASRATRSAPLARSIPVRLFYSTVIVDGGQVIMRPDVYGLDADYARALDRATSQRVASAEGGATRGTGAR